MSVENVQYAEQLLARVAELKAERDEWRETAGRWRRDNDVLVLQVARLRRQYMDAAEIMEAERDKRIAELEAKWPCEKAEARVAELEAMAFGVDGQTLQARIAELEAERDRLRATLGRIRNAPCSHCWGNEWADAALTGEEKP